MTVSPPTQSISLLATTANTLPITVVYSIYDVNMDGTVNILDLTLLRGAISSFTFLHSGRVFLKIVFNDRRLLLAAS